MTRIPFILLSTTDGSPLTGATPSVTISKDGAAFASATNSPAEIGNGYYYVDLTSSETTVTNNVIVRATATGAQPTAIVWEPEQDLSGLSTFDPSTDDVTINATQAATLATAAALTTVGNNVSAVKAKTDNLPASPAAVGSEMALTSEAISNVKDGLATSSELTALETHGDSTWATATGFTVPADLEGLVTTTALVNNLNNLATYGDAHWATADVSEIPTAEENAAAVWDAETRTITDSPDIQAELTTYGAAKTSDIPTAQDIWEYPDRGLTTEIVVGISSQNIADITESVWKAPDRTLTDMKPKPNQKNIVCTPSNVINAYGVPRLENWTNETAGTQAFDDKINTYITLAKEKMATDLNDQINAAIAYIGADNITELCAWLTGYNLYQDDESTDTDSLPETRYNQYLEQIHRIMENI